MGRKIKCPHCNGTICVTSLFPEDPFCADCLVQWDDWYELQEELDRKAYANLIGQKIN